MREKERELRYPDSCGQTEGQVDHYDHYVHGPHPLGAEGRGPVLRHSGYRTVTTPVLSGRGVQRPRSCRCVPSLVS